MSPTPHIPPEILLHIFQFLPSNTQLINLQTLSRSLHHLLRTNYLWRDRYMARICDQSSNEDSDVSAQKMHSSGGALRDPYLYYKLYKNTEARSLWFRSENRRKRVQEFVRHMQMYGISQRVNVHLDADGHVIQNPDAPHAPRHSRRKVLYAVPITDASSGNIVDVYFATRLHYLGYAAILLPLLLRHKHSKRLALYSCVLVFISRYFTYEIYYDAQMRWRRRGVVPYLKSMGFMGMMGVFLATFPFHGIWESVKSCEYEDTSWEGWSEGREIAVNFLHGLYQVVSSILTYV